MPYSLRLCACFFLIVALAALGISGIACSKKSDAPQAESGTVDGLDKPLVYVDPVANERLDKLLEINRHNQDEISELLKRAASDEGKLKDDDDKLQKLLEENKKLQAEIDEIKAKQANSLPSVPVSPAPNLKLTYPKITYPKITYPKITYPKPTKRKDSNRCLVLLKHTVQLTRGLDGDDFITGVIENRTGELVNSVVVSFDLFNGSEKKAVGFTYDDKDMLASGSKWKFKTLRVTSLSSSIRFKYTRFECTDVSADDFLVTGLHDNYWPWKEE